MLAKLNDSKSYPVAMSNSVGSTMDRLVQRAGPRVSYDALYPVDHSVHNLGSEDEVMPILWGDVSISARHPSAITA